MTTVLYELEPGFRLEFTLSQRLSKNLIASNNLRIPPLVRILYLILSNHQNVPEKRYLQIDFRLLCDRFRAMSSMFLFELLGIYYFKFDTFKIPRTEQGRTIEKYIYLEI